MGWMNGRSHHAQSFVHRMGNALCIGSALSTKMIELTRSPSILWISSFSNANHNFVSIKLSFAIWKHLEHLMDCDGLNFFCPMEMQSIQFVLDKLPKTFYSSRQLSSSIHTGAPKRFDLNLFLSLPTDCRFANEFLIIIIDCARPIRSPPTRSNQRWRQSNKQNDSKRDSIHTHTQRQYLVCAIFISVFAETKNTSNSPLHNGKDASESTESSTIINLKFIFCLLFPFFLWLIQNLFDASWTVRREPNVLQQQQKKMLEMPNHWLILPLHELCRPFIVYEFIRIWCSDELAIHAMVIILLLAVIYRNRNMMMWCGTNRIKWISKNIFFFHFCSFQWEFSYQNCVNRKNLTLRQWRRLYWLNLSS